MSDFIDLNALRVRSAPPSVMRVGRVIVCISGGDT